MTSVLALAQFGLTTGFPDLPIGSQKLSCICLLDLSAAFDTIDYDILITHLSSWFGIHGSVLV